MTIDKLINDLIAIRENYGDDLEVRVEDTNYKQYELDNAFNIRLGSFGKDFIALNLKKRVKGKQK